MKTSKVAESFLACRRVAVTGVSRDSANHGSNVVYCRLRERGYEVFAINPNAETVEGDRSYARLEDVPGGIDLVVIGTRPERAEETMKECIALGMTRVWMHRAFGGGSVDRSAVDLGRAHGITVIDGGCPCMFAPTDDGAHRFLRRVCMLTGAVPRQVPEAVVGG
ncbi:CoA-binding protein [Nocardioides cynanchi]|uniref:CoA-binding protein n=1 Tax=Nocardioides cynanchi TaxID=2558918 RepID=UPI001244C5E4|nr:CoA-binding protein [Nocardioides cynanchi]